MMVPIQQVKVTPAAATNPVPEKSHATILLSEKMGYILLHYGGCAAPFLMGSTL
jgi:hypothetical protein